VVAVEVRFAHVNLVAEDWRRLASFYESVFGCERVPPERDQHGEWLERATGLAGAHIRGVHLRLPGTGDGGPTLEVYEYAKMPARSAVKPNTPGFSHIAFAVADVPAMVERVINEGGSRLGELTEVEVAGKGRLTFQYVADPEGNIIELQNWE
jgi:predicted enzyme related to lactoylglutathione lyase